MDDDRNKRLLDLGAEALVDVLLELASQDDAASERVERMIASPSPVEDIQRFKTKLAAIKRSQRFIRRGEGMETGACDLAATVVYRALLDSILRRGQTKTYPHEVRYLKKLDRLAKTLSDWCGQGAHDVYLQQLRQSHAESPISGLSTESDDQYGLICGESGRD